MVNKHVGLTIRSFNLTLDSDVILDLTGFQVWMVPGVARKGDPAGDQVRHANDRALVDNGLPDGLRTLIRNCSATSQPCTHREQSAEEIYCEIRS